VTPAFVQETFDAAVLYEQGGVPPPPTPVVLPSGEFSVLPATLAAGGGTVALSWGNTLNTTSASIGGIGAVALTGDATIVVTASRDFSLVLTGPGGTTTITKRVTVAGAPPPPPPTGGFPAGAVVRVVLTTDCVNVRSAPNLNSTVLHCEAAGTRGTVISGPTVADGYSFYYIRYADSHTGWSAGKYLELTSAPPPPPPVTPLPSGSLTVSKIQNGQAQAWWTAKDDTVGQLAGYPRIGTLSGSLTFSILKDTTLTLTLWGRGGTTNYTAYTASGVDPVQPPAAGCDTAALVARGFALARAKFDSVFAAGVASKVCPPPDTTATAIKRALAPWLK
jgi:hypothetical protein